jgi:hypothetical protein
MSHCPGWLPSWCGWFNCFANVPPVIIATKFPSALSWRLIASTVAKLPDWQARLDTRRIGGETKGGAKPEVPAGQMRASTMECESMPNDVIRSFTRLLCNPGRVFEWQVIALRAGGG